MIMRAEPDVARLKILPFLAALVSPAVHAMMTRACQMLSDTPSSSTRLWQSKQ